MRPIDLSNKPIMAVLGIALAAGGFAFAMITGAPTPICNTPSGYCLDILPTYRALLIGIGSAIMSLGFWVIGTLLRTKLPKIP